MTGYCLPAHVTGAQAAAYFARPRFANLFGCLAPSIRVAAPQTPASRIPPFVERFWMPAYAICVRSISSKGEQHTWTSVDGISGVFTLLECVEELAERLLEEESFPAGIGEAGAGELARHGLLRYIMAQRGQIDKPVVDAVTEIRPYHYPVWVYYFRRFGSRIDFKVLDGYSARSGGAKMRVAVLDVLIAAKRNRA